MIVMISLNLVYGENAGIPDQFNEYFANLRISFDKIADSPHLKDRNLNRAESIFLRELKGNLEYNTFIRTNSKGQVVSEAVRGSKIIRSLRNVSSQAWFKRVKRTKEGHYDFIKDNEQGRYYLLWAKPILTSKGTFIGAVVAKIDLWDSFYEFSNNVYYPFLIKINKLNLFVHKWNNDFTGVEEAINIDGVSNVSVLYIPEKKAPPVDSSSLLSETPAVDSSKIVLAKQQEEIEKQSKIRFFILVLLIAAVVIGGYLFYGKIRHAMIMRKIDKDDF